MPGCETTIEIIETSALYIKRNFSNLSLLTAWTERRATCSLIFAKTFPWLAKGSGMGMLHFAVHGATDAVWCLQVQHTQLYRCRACVRRVVRGYHPLVSSISKTDELRNHTEEIAGTGPWPCLQLCECFALSKDTIDLPKSEKEKARHRDFHGMGSDAGTGWNRSFQNVGIHDVYLSA